MLFKLWIVCLISSLNYIYFRLYMFHEWRTVINCILQRVLLNHASSFQRLSIPSVAPKPLNVVPASKLQSLAEACIQDKNRHTRRSISFESKSKRLAPRSGISAANCLEARSSFIYRFHSNVHLDLY